MKTKMDNTSKVTVSGAGNGCLLVIVNSAGNHWDHLIVKETILDALTHFGMPYRVLDLALQRPAASVLSNCACVILAQNRLGSYLTEAETALIADAVKEGIGLVNFDSDLCLYKMPLLVDDEHTDDEQC